MIAGCETPTARGRRMMKESGYKSGGDVPGRARGGELTNTDRRREAAGLEPHAPLARGGATKHHGKGHVGQVNVIVGRGGGAAEQQAATQRGLQAGVALGARAAAQKLAGAGGAPPGAPPGPPPGPPGPPMMAGAPPGAPGGMPPPRGGMPVKDGGMVKVRQHERRRAGGGV